jgi:beta-glucosidase-like glycosyl hydrolase
VYASENRWLLTDVLRGEWGFDGTVASGWGALRDRVAALSAGLDLTMSGGDAEEVPPSLPLWGRDSLRRSWIDGVAENVV